MYKFVGAVVLFLRSHALYSELLSVAAALTLPKSPTLLLWPVCYSVTHCLLA